MMFIHFPFLYCLKFNVWIDLLIQQANQHKKTADNVVGSLVESYLFGI